MNSVIHPVSIITTRGRDLHYFTATLITYLVIIISTVAVRSSLVNFRAGFLFIGIAAVFGLLIAGMILRKMINSPSPLTSCSPACRLTLVLSPIPFAVLFYSAVPALHLPLINDISTDTINPPQFLFAADLRDAGDHSVIYQGDTIASQQQSAYPDIHTIHLISPLKQVSASIKNYIERQGWQLISNADDSSHLEAVATSPVFKFRDDIVVRLTASNDVTSIDIRSASRIGKSDLGQNARRIRQMLDYLFKRFPVQLPPTQHSH
jgi:uncharacterized protein (DUF1499 family)